MTYSSPQEHGLSLPLVRTQSCGHTSLQQKMGNVVLILFDHVPCLKSDGGFLTFIEKGEWILKENQEFLPLVPMKWSFDLELSSLNEQPLPCMGFSSSSVGKESACSAGDLGLIPGLGRSPGEGNGNPLQYSCLENSMDRRAWQATVHGIAKSQTQLCDYVHVHVHPCKEIFVFTGNLVSYKAYHMAQCWGPASAGSRRPSG